MWYLKSIAIIVPSRALICFILTMWYLKERFNILNEML